MAGFVTVQDERLHLDGEEYNYVGANFWYGVNLGAEEQGDRERLVRELDMLKERGITNFRIIAGSQGPADREKSISPSLESSLLSYDDDIWGGFDFFLDEM